MGFVPLRDDNGAIDTDVSDAPDGFLDNFEPGGKGVDDPLDGVRVLRKIHEKYIYIFKT